MKIRSTTDDDHSALSRLYHEAFGKPEGPSVAALAISLSADQTAVPLCSLIAEEDRHVVGHVAFSAARLGPGGDIPIRVLAPLAVVPVMQRQGIGSRLVRTGLARLTEEGVGLVFTLGDPAYYSRFGFEPVRGRGFRTPHPIPPAYADAWMVCSPTGNTPAAPPGRVQCCDALDRPELWWE